MTGSLQVKKGYFYIVLNTYENGKRKAKWIATGLTTKGNKKQAEKLLRDELGKYETREKLVKTDMLFSDSIRQWLEASAIRVDEVTYQL